jgi:surfeit locus 1 family protein
MQRLEWKNNLIKTREQGLRAEPIPLNLDNDPVDLPRELAWRPVSIEGKWLHHKEVHMVPRVYDGKGGAHIITPLDTAQGRILVNRGFVPTEKLDRTTRPESLPKGTVTVKGTLREISSKPSWVPENDPKKNCWYWVDIPALSLHTDSDPFFLEELLDEENPTRLPIGGQLHQPLSNNHFQYVFTWFTLGFILTGMSYLLVRRGRLPPTNRPPYIVKPKHRPGLFR